MYDLQIFNEVQSYNQERFAGFSKLMRMTFDEAATYFSDGSIDLLHVDGLHTYEAVRHDFETWLPKLAPGAVVLFHDTDVRERNFGVWRLWEELKEQYANNIEFSHSYGLGVLQLNNAPNEKKLFWLDPNCPERQNLVRYFASLGEKQSERFELFMLKKDLGQITGQIDKLKQLIQERDSQIDQLKRLIQERDWEIVALRNPLRWLVFQVKRFLKRLIKIVRII